MSTRDISSPNTTESVINPIDLTQGGTGVTTIPNAVAALKAVPTSQLNVPGGIAGIDDNLCFPVFILPESFVPMISLKPLNDFGNSGEIAVGVSGSIQFEITNYDSYTEYTVKEIDAGTVSISGKIITYTAPAITGVFGFTVNSKPTSVTVKTSIPVKPSTTAITTGSYDSNLKLTLVTSDFANSSGGSATHASTSWVVSSKPDMSDALYSSINDTQNKTTSANITIPFNSTVTYFYAAAQHIDSNGNKSPWSEIVKITTKSHYIANQEIACIANQTDATTSGFGSRLYLSDDGLRLVITNKNKTVSSYSNAGGVYIYLRVNNTWSLEAAINNPEPIANGYFGRSVIGDADCTRIAVGADGNQTSATSKGAVYVFIRSGTTWSQEAKLVASDAATGDQFGYSLTHSNSFSRVAVGAPGKNTNTGAVYVFIRSGTTWSQEAKLVASDAATGDQFGTAVSFARTVGAQIAVAAPYKTSGALAGVGAVYIFSRSNSTYSQESKLVPSDAVANENISFIEFVSDGLSLLVSRSKLAKVELYKRTGTVYVISNSFTSSRAVIDSFGKEFWADSTGKKILISDQYYSARAISSLINGLPKSGALHLYELQSDNTTWTETIINAVIPEENALYSKTAAISSDMLKIAVSSLGCNASLSTSFGSVHSLVTS